MLVLRRQLQRRPASAKVALWPGCGQLGPLAALLQLLVDYCHSLEEGLPIGGAGCVRNCSPPGCGELVFENQPMVALCG